MITIRPEFSIDGGGAVRVRREDVPDYILAALNRSVTGRVIIDISTREADPAAPVEAPKEVK